MALIFIRLWGSLCFELVKIDFIKLYRFIKQFKNNFKEYSLFKLYSQHKNKQTGE
jgi:hypothetical protein